MSRNATNTDESPELQHLVEELDVEDTTTGAERDAVVPFTNDDGSPEDGGAADSEANAVGEEDSGPFGNGAISLNVEDTGEELANRRKVSDPSDFTGEKLFTSSRPRRKSLDVEKKTTSSGLELRSRKTIGGAGSDAMAGSMRRTMAKRTKATDQEKKDVSEAKRRIMDADENFFAEVKTIFERFDEDNSGSIDRFELAKVLDSLGYALTSEQIDELLQQVDVDGGGTLDIDEFTVLIRLWKDAAQFKIFESDASVTRDHMQRSVNTKSKALLDDERWRWIWQIVLTVVALYFWVTVFLLWNFQGGERADLEFDFIAPDVICTLILAVEMFLRFQIGYLEDKLDEMDVLIDDKKLIALRYLRTWFFFDLLCTMPFHLFTTNPEVAFSLRHLRLLLVLRIPFLFNESKLINITANYVQFHFAFLPFFHGAVAFVCCILTLAMIHQALTRQAINNSSSHPVNGPPDEDQARFATSLYWTMYVVAGVGYGDITPVTENHRWYACFLFVFSMITNGLFVGSMVTLMQEADVESYRQSRLVLTKAVLRFFEVPPGLENEILQFQNHTLARDIAISYRDLVQMLPTDMQQSILMQSRVPLLKGIRIFQGTHMSTLVQVAEKLQQFTHTPEQYVAMYGEENYAMFVVNYGFIDVLGPLGQYITTIKREDSFGEVGLLRTGVTFEVGFKCMTYCDFFALSKDDLDEVMVRFPRFAHDMKSKRLLVNCMYHEKLVDMQMRREISVGTFEDTEASKMVRTITGQSANADKVMRSTSMHLEEVDGAAMGTASGDSGSVSPVRAMTPRSTPSRRQSTSTDLVVDLRGLVVHDIPSDPLSQQTPASHDQLLKQSAETQQLVTQLESAIQEILAQSSSNPMPEGL